MDPSAAREYARQAATRAHGWLSDAQGEALFTAASAPHPGAIVEIGSWQGRSTIWLAVGAGLSGRRVFAVDPHEGSREDPSARTYDQFIENLRAADVLRVVTPLVMRSSEAVAHVTGAVGLLFVDGDHSIDAARADAELWLPRVQEGGTVMFHDVATSGYAGPRRAFQRLVCADRRFRRIRKVGSMAVAERSSGRNRVDGMYARTFGMLLYWYDIQGAIKRALRSARRLVGRPPRLVDTSVL
jgi:predicted O-methyltransferase YrrM